MAAVFQNRSDSVDQASTKMSRGFIPSRPIRRLGLVSPWAGGNLGNSAILSAVIFNITKRVSAVEFLGITLNSEEVRRRFGIEGFPLASATRYGYSRWTTDDAWGREGGSTLKERIKQRLKRISLVRRLASAARTCRYEIAHIVAANRAVRRLDAVIIPGGGALDEFWGGPWGHPWNLLKWSVLSSIHRVPFLVLSVGKCSLERPASRWFVRVALKLASYRSYRDAESKKGVQTLIDASQDPVLPDLAFSYPIPVIQKPQAADSANRPLIIGISPIAYCDPRVWPEKDEKRYSAYVRRMVEIVKWLLQGNHRVLFFATDSPDLETIKDVLNGIRGTAKEPGAVQILPGPIEQSIDNHLEEIGRTDLTIASRLHGVILSHLVAIPVLAISYDPKVDAQMGIAKQTDYCLDIEALELKTFVKRFEALKVARVREAAHLRCDALVFRQQLDSQYDHILGLDTAEMSSRSTGQTLRAGRISDRTSLDERELVPSVSPVDINP
jgi:polysaccharide pyruvyl transferase WcaK-like protein